MHGRLARTGPWAAVALCWAAAVCGGAQSLPAGGETVGAAPSVYYTPKPVEVASPAALDLLLHAQAPRYVIHADDVLTAKVYGVKDFDVRARVDENGMVALPLIGSLKLAGLTVAQAEEIIDASLLNAQMVQAPSTTVELVERPQQQVTVSGDVGKPGVYAAAGSHTLSDYLSQAGELRETASSTITLTRPGFAAAMAIPLGGDPTNNHNRAIPIFAGDEIHVSGSGVIYVIGALRAQGAFPLKNSTPTTVMQAVTLAGGVGYEAASGSTRLVRTEDGQRIMLNLDLGKIMAGKAPDIALRNDDILYVPSNKAKAAIKGGGTGLIVTLASTYLYNR